jgi:alpha-ribazole phosphatase
MRFLSTTDAPLGAEGRVQCEPLREALREMSFDRCVTSPMRRCLETRALVAPEVPFTIEPALREVDFGAWEGRTLDWVERSQPQLLAQRRADPVHFRPPDGETIEEAAARLRPLADRLHDEDGTTLIIGHRIALAILERLVRELPLESQAVVGLQPAEFRIVRA